MAKINQYDSQRPTGPDRGGEKRSNELPLSVELPYQFTDQDVKNLRQEGLLPPSVWAEYNRSETKQLQPAHGQLIATEIADRFRAGKTQLPAQLNAIFIQDTATTRLSKQLFNAPAKEVDDYQVRQQAAKEAHFALPVWQPSATSMPRFYASSFDLGDGISVGSLLPATGKGRDTDKLLEIIPVSTTEAYVRYADSADAHKFAFSDPHAYLNQANATTLYAYDHREHSHVSTLQPGRLLLEGDKWRQIEKVGIRFDNLTPQQTFVQAPGMSEQTLTSLVQSPSKAEPALPQQQPDNHSGSGKQTVTVQAGKQPVLNEREASQPPIVAPALIVPVAGPAINTGVVNTVESGEKPTVEKSTNPGSIRLTLVDDQRAESELLKERLYEALIPAEYQELRSFLRNDGFLSNDEINTALRDARLDRNDLAQSLADKAIPSDDPALQEKMTDYLWELHEIIRDPTVERVRADKFYQVQTIQTQLGTNPELAEESEQAGKKADKSLEIVHGGLITNFLHNFKKAHQLDHVPPIEMEKKTRYQWQDVESSLAKMGITQELLETSGNMDRLLKGEKTGLIDFKSTYNDQETQLRGKIYLVRQGKEIKPYFQTQKQSLIVPDQYLGFRFSEEDKANLKEKGELGKRVELEDAYTRKKFDAFVGVDRDTNSLTVWRAERAFIPMQIKGVDVSADQQETLRQGGSIRLSGLTSENGQKYDADIQLSASRRSVGFSPPSEAIKQSIDNKVAKDLERSSDQLRGTSAGAATTQDKSPVQQRKKATAKQSELVSEREKPVTSDGQAQPGKSPKKGNTKKKKPQQEQGIGV